MIFESLNNHLEVILMHLISNRVVFIIIYIQTENCIDRLLLGIRNFVLKILTFIKFVFVQIGIWFHFSRIIFEYIYF